MKRGLVQFTLVTIVLLLFFTLNRRSLAECPSLPKVQSILNRISKVPIVVKKVEEIKEFPLCKIETFEGENFFLSLNEKYLIEGILIKVPPLILSESEYRVLKRNVISSIGRGPEVLVITNPLCKVCKRNKEKIFSLSKKFKLSFVMVGFKKEEVKAAASAICNKESIETIFEPKTELKVCDLGKLKVWSVSGILKKYGITGTPVFVFPDRKVAVGVKDFESMLENF
jgi:thiol:disulfide interchange protein DsbC